MPVTTFNHNLVKIGKRQYRNPVYLAKEWRELLDNGVYTSSADLARHLKVSRARVTQILNLLKLSPEVIEKISSLGDTIKSPFVSERRLRPLSKMMAENQIEQIKTLISKSAL